MSDPNSAKIFLSYRRGDSPGYASRLESDLEEALGEGRVFRDVEDIKGGAKWMEALERNLREAAAVLLIIGPRWEEIWRERSGDDGVNYVALELEMARRAGAQVIPVTLNSTRLSRDLDLGEIAWVRDHQFYDISDQQGRWEHDVGGLIDRLRELEGLRPERPEARPERPSPRPPANRRSTAAAGPSQPDIGGRWLESDGGAYVIETRADGSMTIEGAEARGWARYHERMPRKLEFELEGVGRGELSVSAGDSVMKGWILVGGRRKRWLTWTREE